MNKKILILYTAIGLGHKSIAENIGYYLEQAGYEVELADAQKVQGGILVSWGTRSYQRIVRSFSFIWSWLYNTQWLIAVTLPYRTWLAGFNYDHILSLIEKSKPDLVISTHNTSSAVVAYLKDKQLYQGLFGIAFSDFHLHRYWLFEQADFFLVNIKEQKQEMVALGFTAEKIFVCGMTLQPKMQIDVAVVKQKFGINPQEKIVLISSGSQGFGLSDKLIAKFLQHKDVRVIAVCGKNVEMLESLKKKFAGTKAIILNYYSPMDELYAIADVFVSKPGGLSTAEALRWQLPIIVSHILPGQEEWNYRYLQDKGLVMPATLGATFNIIEETVMQELLGGAFRKSLAQNSSLRELFYESQAVVAPVKTVLEDSVEGR
jgi:processive 1,2-diacylglycerol beta-glucosyltransferase